MIHEARTDAATIKARALAASAAEILAAIREAYPKAAVVREVSIRDEAERAFYYRWQLDNDRDGGWWEEFIARHGLPVADSLPVGWIPQTSVPVRRIDALMRESTGYTAIEIKVTRSDFKRESEEKRRAWKAHTRRFVYAAPAGLLLPEEIPDGCGLWEFNGRGLKATKRAKVNKKALDLPRSVVDSMLYRVSNYEKRPA